MDNKFALFYQKEDMETSKYYLEGRMLKKVKDYDAAYVAYQSAIQNGDAKGYYGLALLCEEIQDSEMNLQKMYDDHFLDIKQAALQGDSVAASIVGVYYAMGLGSIMRNQEQAHMWFLIGALGGDEVAQFNLAIHYYFGEIVKKDYNCALHWLEMAASKEYEPAKLLIDEIQQEMNERRNKNDF